MAYISLRSIREQKGLTIAQLAGKASISIRTLQAYEAGERTIASDDLRKLARILVTTPAEILRPGEPPPEPPAPPPPPIESPPLAESPSEASRAADPAAHLDVQNVHDEPVPRSAPAVMPLEAPTAMRPPRNPLGSAIRRPLGSSPPRPPAAPRPARAPRPVAAPAPATPGQLDQIRHIARRLGLDDSALAEQIGTPLDALNQATARTAIGKLHQTMEESGTWRPRVGEGPDQEGEYLAKLRQQAIPIEVLVFGGERLRGMIEDFTPYAIRLRRDDGSETMIRKLAILYYHTQGIVDNAPGAANDAQ